MKIKVAPSILTADFGDLHNEIHSLVQGGADLLHLDIMDGQFVPRITFGDPIVAAIRKNFPDLFLEAHLMTKTPLGLVDDLIQAGVDRILIHIEAVDNLRNDLELIKSMGCQVGVALNPATGIDGLLDVVSICDVMLVMTVNPGWGGQKFITEMLSKITSLREMIKSNPTSKSMIEVDGGINDETGRLSIEAGAEILVVGSYLLKESERGTVIDRLRRLGDF
jgi:ribulose-phosphate 3-epimerase